ncbi:MAG: AAA family ATPase, partial [Anaerolineae bacterium]|nr:AAA family ATPase [Anaerolineae bacterium]MDW7991432.1 AAA family ATPase [Anaerolineae bacterium]
VTLTIALAGKGGTGKTTVAVCLIRYLLEERRGSVLAIDADPAMNLPLVLGMEVETTVGDIREDMLDLVQSSGALAGSMPGGMSKQDYLDYQVKMALVEGDRVDLLAMGRPEGPGCYCAANQMLRVIIDRLSTNYDYVVIDNEAGMEHLSRRTTRDVDILLLVTDPTQRGIAAAKEMARMVPGLDIRVGRVYLVVNRVRDGLPPPLAEAVVRTGLELIGTVPEDPAMAEFEISGRPLVQLPSGTAVYQAVREIARKMLGGE